MDGVESDRGDNVTVRIVERVRLGVQRVGGNLEQVVERRGFNLFLRLVRAPCGDDSLRALCGWIWALGLCAAFVRTFVGVVAAARRATIASDAATVPSMSTRFRAVLTVSRNFAA
jgi:hypothetical protein